MTRRIETPIGPLYATANDEGLCRLVFDDRPDDEGDGGGAEFLAAIDRELVKYFDGTLREFRTPISMQGTEFQLTVWRELCKIPYGETISYTELSKRLENPIAIRAAAAANGANRIAIVVPCHRVIAANGALQGYRGGLERKRFLIDHERGQAGLF